MSANSFGSVDTVAQAAGNNVLIEGWAVDPKTTAPIMVAVYVDGVLSTNATANALRTDVGAAFPTLGSNHGFAVTVPVAAGGSHIVDVYALDSTGNGNTAIGFSALFNNTMGDSNTAIGSQTLFRNTTGNGNTATGVSVLAHNTTGSFNTATGGRALEFNTTGINNTATGFTGDVVIAIGNDASGVLGPATLGGTLTVAATLGVATFGDLTIDKPGVGYTLVVNATGLTGATSNGFTVIGLGP